MFVIIWLMVSMASVYTIIQVLLIAIRNYKAHKFFSTNAPGLPVIPGTPNLFLGQLKSVIIRDDNVKIITQLHKQLGPTFGYYFCEQPWVSTKDLDLIKLIEVEEAHKHLNRAPFRLAFKQFSHSIFQANDDAWRRIRSSVAPALTNRKVRSDETTSDIEGILEQLAAGLKSRLIKSGETGEQARSMILDAGDMFQRYALAVIFLITYEQENIIDFFAPEDQWTSLIAWASARFNNPFLTISFAFPFTNPLILQLIKLHPAGKIHKQMVSFITKAIEQSELARKRLDGSKEGGEPLVSGLARPKNQRLINDVIDALFNRRINLEESIGTLEFLLLAGVETTADTTTCLLWHLARHPEIQEQLRNSLRLDGLDSQYLEWCIKETIRIHPAVPLGVGRVLGTDVELHGLRLPKGTFVMPSIHSIHHDPEIWPEPDKFKPERWQQAAEYHTAAFMGFGLGARNCVGGKLAMHEIKLAIRMLLKSYRIEKCSETPDRYSFNSPIMLMTLTDEQIKLRLVELDD